MSHTFRLSNVVQGSQKRRYFIMQDIQGLKLRANPYFSLENVKLFTTHTHMHTLPLERKSLAPFSKMQILIIFEACSSLTFLLLMFYFEKKSTETMTFLFVQKKRRNGIYIDVNIVLRKNIKNSLNILNKAQSDAQFNF